MFPRDRKRCTGRSTFGTDVVGFRERQRGVAVILVAFFGLGGQVGAHSTGPPGEDLPPALKQALVAMKQATKETTPHDKSLEPLKVFSEQPFYLNRLEPEEVLVGLLQSAPVRDGPNTRDMPFKLVVGPDAYSVYVAGFDHALLRPYVGYNVEVVGKRIDQREEGYGIEIWIATISMHRS